MKWKRIRDGVFEAQSKKLIGRYYNITKIRCGWVVSVDVHRNVCVCKYKYEAVNVCETMDKRRVL